MTRPTFFWTQAARVTAMGVALTAAVSGCATHTVLPKADPLDVVLADYAKSSVSALRDLADANGRNVVETTVPQPKAAPPAAPAPVAPPAPMTIATRYSTAAVEDVAPATSVAPGTPAAPVPGETAAPVAAPQSTGVVISGGLLSTPPAGLEKLITVHWTGELEQLLAQIAAETGWKMTPATGVRVVPVLVSLNAQNRSAFDVLRDIGAITNQAADVVISAKTQTISVRYPNR